MLKPLIDQLYEKWVYKDSFYLDQRGIPGGDMIRGMAYELKDTCRNFINEPLTLREASEETGYSYSALHRRVQEGTIPLVEGSGVARVRRKHLPYRAHEEVELQVR